ncbi:hypothetical protein RI129_007298 [Pyrocoelia pectoralis]|uniref:Uncharacterized protein n=1 Tax=Pyrocoelia pectoralis TaxID=417401 RepID=A0AAN7VAW1_9COLE
MTKLKIIFFILLSLMVRVRSDNNYTSGPQARIDIQQSIEKTRDEPSLMSKIASWIFPFGGTKDDPPAADAVPLETSRQQSHQYLPPQQPQQVCNPCNQEPWVPIATKHGQNTVIGFVHPHQQQTSPLQYGPPSHQYGPPQQYGAPPAPTKQYGPPPLPNKQHGAPSPPQVKHHGAPPSSQYGVPHSPSNQYGLPHTPSNQYGSPIPTHQYGPPPSTMYGVPNDQQGYYSNIKQNYRLPPNNYIPPTFFVPPPTGKAPLYKYGNRNKPSKNNKFVQGKAKQPRPVPQHGPPIPLNFVKATDPPPYPFESTQPLSLEFRPPSAEHEIFKSYAPLLTNYDIPLQLPHLEYLSQHLQTPFRDSSHQVSSGVGHQSAFTNSNNHEPVVQLIPSIRVADFVSTVEHPINVIQSPIVEVLATSNDIPKVKENVINYGINEVQTSQRPISIDDTQASGTAQNATYYNLVHEQNRNNELQEPAQSLNVFSNINVQEVVQSVPTTHITYESGQYSSEPLLQTAQNTIGVGPTPQTFNNLPSWTTETSIQDQSGQFSYAAFQSNKDYKQTPGVSTENPQFPLFLQQIPPTRKPEFASQQTDAVQNKGDEKTNQKFSAPVLHFADWIPNLSDLSTIMVPPPVKQPSWDTTKKPKHVQIIIPYRLSDVKGEASAILPLYTQPPSADKSPVWGHYALDYSPEASKQVVVTAQKPTESILNIRDLVTGSDIFKLQKNIDGWTEQEFSNTIASGPKLSSTSSKLIPSKKIPSEYLLSTHPYRLNENITTKSVEFNDHASTSSTKDIDSNLIITGSSTTEGSTNTNIASMVPVLSTLPNWEKLQMSISPLTKEKIYVVTPQPWKFLIPKEINEKLFPFTESPNVGLSSKFSVVINGGDKNRTKIDKDGLKVIYSEWPHLINKLMTTTTEEPKSTGHPLFGLMDLTSVTEASNSTVVTYSGHSRVVTGVTTASVIKTR